MSKETLYGDVLLLAGIISYLGPFRSDIRTELLSKWRKLCQTGNINTSPEDAAKTPDTNMDGPPLETPFGFHIPLSENLQLPLAQALDTPQETPQRKMILKLLLWGCRRSWVQGWPLLVDTEQHQDISSKNCIISGKSKYVQMSFACKIISD